MITLAPEQLALLCAGAALGGVLFGITGFAAGIVMSLFIHYGFTAADSVFIIAGGSIVLNVGLLPRFWREIRLRAALPYLVGGTFGLPLGLWLLQHLDPRMVRATVAVLVIAYGLFALRQHTREPLRFSAARGRIADGSIGFTGGVVGGFSGLAPMVPGVWYGLRGLDKLQQRALMQPYGLYVQSAMLAWLLATGTVSRHAAEGLAIAAPVWIAASYIGLRGFERLATAHFQRGVVIIAIAGALTLLGRQL